VIREKWQRETETFAPRLTFITRVWRPIRAEPEGAGPARIIARASDAGPREGARGGLLARRDGFPCSSETLDPPRDRPSIYEPIKPAVVFTSRGRESGRLALAYRDGINAGHARSSAFVPLDLSRNWRFDHPVSVFRVCNARAIARFSAARRSGNANDARRIARNLASAMS